MENTNTEISFANEVEAAYAILYAVIGIDGSIDKFEIEALVQAVTLKKTFRVDSTGYFENAKFLIENFGAIHVAKSAAALLSDDLKKGVFVIALDLVYANDNLEAAEQNFINELAAIFELDKAWAKTATDIISLKYT